MMPGPVKAGTHDIGRMQTMDARIQRQTTMNTDDSSTNDMNASTHLWLAGQAVSAQHAELLACLRAKLGNHQDSF